MGLPQISHSLDYAERKHDEKNISRAVDKVTLMSASYCATNAHICFSKPDLFKHFLLLWTPRVDMDSGLLSAGNASGTCLSSRLAAVLGLGMPSPCIYSGLKHTRMRWPAAWWL